MSNPVPTNTYQTFPNYKDANGVTASVPFLLPPTFTVGGPTTVTISLVYQGGSPTPLTPPCSNDFTLDWNIPKQPTTGNVTLTVTIAAGNQWSCSQANRDALRANYALLGAALDTMEIGGVLVPGATALILRRVGEVMAAPISESLFYLHGLNTGLNTAQACPYVNLLPGMRLLIQPQATQFVGVGSTANGPVAAGEQTFQLGNVTGPDGLCYVSFNGFLTAISPPEIANVPLSGTAPQVVIAGALDLQAAGTACRWYRLLYPPKLPPATSAGDAQLGDSITLVGAQSWADLELATAAFQSGQPATNAAKPLVYSVFRGRLSVIPQVAVAVNNKLVYVPLGTTVRNVLESLAPSNPLTWDTDQQQNLVATTNRLMTNETNAKYPQPVKVAFNPAPNATPLPDPGVYDLPLAHGDSLNVTAWPAAPA